MEKQTIREFQESETIVYLHDGISLYRLFTHHNGLYDAIRLVESWLGFNDMNVDIAETITVVEV